MNEDNFSYDSDVSDSFDMAFVRAVHSLQENDTVEILHCDGDISLHRNRNGFVLEVRDSIMFGDRLDYKRTEGNCLFGLWDGSICLSVGVRFWDIDELVVRRETETTLWEDDE